MNYDDSACSIACYKGNICGAGGQCYCKGQDPFTLLPATTNDGLCLGTQYDSWTITGECVCTSLLPPPLSNCLASGMSSASH